MREMYYHFQPTVEFGQTKTHARLARVEFFQFWRYKPEWQSVPVA